MNFKDVEFNLDPSTGETWESKNEFPTPNTENYYSNSPLSEDQSKPVTLPSNHEYVTTYKIINLTSFKNAQSNLSMMCSFNIMYANFRLSIFDDSGTFSRITTINYDYYNTLRLVLFLKAKNDDVFKVLEPNIEMTQPATEVYIPNITNLKYVNNILFLKTKEQSGPYEGRQTTFQFKENDDIIFLEMIKDLKSSWFPILGNYITTT